MTKTFENLITLTQVSDGAQGAPGRDASGYFVESNVEEVYYWKTSGNRNTPDANFLEISLSKLNENDKEKINLTKENCNFFVIGREENSLADFYDFEKTYEEIDENNNVSETKITGVLFFKTNEFLNDEMGFKKLNSDNILLQFSYESEDTQVIKTFPISLGTSKEMAQFNIEATNINAAIQSSILEFDKTGLNIYGAGIKVYDNNQTRNLLFGFDNDALYVEGRINATSGKFIGEIEATKASFQSGVIGGFNINNGNLSSTSLFYKPTQDETPQSNKDYYIKDVNSYIKANVEESFEEGKIYYESIPSIVLSGNSGLIRAEDIILGTGAQIENYLKLGSAYIYNPITSNANGKFIQCGENGEIIINQNGTASFGSINVDGPNSKIYGVNWNITPDKASFTNVEISGVIRSATFETGSTQAVGSAMIFMPTYKIEGFKKEGEIEKIYKVEIAQDISSVMEAGCAFWLVDKESIYFKQVAMVVDPQNIMDEKKTVITFESEEELSDKTFISLIVIGQTEQDIKPMIMSINSGVNLTDNKSNAITYGRGFTIKEYDAPGANLFLGDLNQYNTNYSGYGLFSDNVYLNGSLTTKVTTIDENENETAATYAGVNTLSSANATQFDHWKDESKIVFWAGASSTKAESIQIAPFQVTEEGSIYASRAHLTNSIFSGGDIVGADIYAARIHGSNSDKSSSALTIYDTAQGIIFKTGFEKEEAITFSIGADGLKTGLDKHFINIISEEDGNKKLVKFYGEEFFGNVIRTNGSQSYLALKTIDNIPTLHHTHSANQSCGFYFEDGKTTYKITTKTSDNKIMDYEKLIMNKEQVEFIGDVKISSSTSRKENMQYKSVNGGYDLYIIDENANYQEGNE